MKIYARNAFREFLHRKWRISAGIAGYAVAVSIVVSLLVWMDFARLSTDRVLADVGAHFIGYMLEEGPSAESIAKDPAEGFVAAGARSELFSDRLAEEVRALPSVWDASPAIFFRARSEDDNHMYILGGFDPLHPVSVNKTVCAPGDVVNGRYIEPGERGAAMLESDYAFTRGLGVGDEIAVGEHKLEVAGIVRPVLRPAKADVYMHIDDLRSTVSDRVRPGSFPADAVNMLLVEAQNARSMDAAMTGMGGLHPNFRAFGYGCWRPAARAMGMGENAVGFLVGTMLAGLFLFIGKTQLASVVEREHDIGILRVLGWSKKNVVMQVLTESVMISAAGSFTGFIIAGLVVYLVPLKAVTDFPAGAGVVISPFLLFWVLIISVAGGILAGIIPAVVTAGRSPAESLRKL